MPGKRFGAEQIIPKLREAEVDLAKGLTVAQACKKIGVTEKTYYRWRKEYRGIRMDQAKRMKDLEKENARLKRAAGGRRAGQGYSARGGFGKLLSPAKRRRAVQHVRNSLGQEQVSERRACQVLPASFDPKAPATHAGR